MALLLAACDGPGAGETNEAITAKLPPAETSDQTTAFGPFPSPSVAPQPSPGDKAIEERPAAGPEPALSPGRASSRLHLPRARRVHAGRRRPASIVRHSPPLHGHARLCARNQRQRRAAGYSQSSPPTGSACRLLWPSWRPIRASARWPSGAATPSGRPRALIVRLNATGNNARVSNLIVTRLAAPACIVAVIPRGPRQNEKARAIADGRRLDCLSE